jgi:hypothetical protein
MRPAPLLPALLLCSLGAVLPACVEEEPDDFLRGPYTCYYDGDNDGFGAPAPFESQIPCSEVDFAADNADDCDDGADWIFPGAQEVLADGFDTDCDGIDPWPCYIDGDGDGFGVELDPMGYAECEEDPGHSPFDGDCDDGDGDAYPYAPEVADDGIDQDCDGLDAVSCWWDGDGDGFGSGSPGVVAEGDCVGEGFSPYGDDCVDMDSMSYDASWFFPGAPEVCDGATNDCDAAGAFAGNHTWSWDFDAWSFLALDADDAITLPVGGGGSVWTLDLELRDSVTVGEHPLLWKVDAAGELEFEVVRHEDWTLLVRVGPEAAWTMATAAVPLPDDYSGAGIGRHVALVVDGAAITVLSGGEVLAQGEAPHAVTLSPATPVVVGARLGVDGLPMGASDAVYLGDTRYWDRALGADELALLQCRRIRLDTDDASQMRFLLSAELVWNTDPALGGEYVYAASIHDGSAQGSNPGFMGDPVYRSQAGDLALLQL